VTSVKHTGVVRFIHWSEIFVPLKVMAKNHRNVFATLHRFTDVICGDGLFQIVQGLGEGGNECMLGGRLRTHGCNRVVLNLSETLAV